MIFFVNNLLKKIRIRVTNESGSNNIENKLILFLSQNLGLFNFII